jgi:hypothetical protein
MHQEKIAAAAALCCAVFLFGCAKRSDSQRLPMEIIKATANGDETLLEAKSPNGHYKITQTWHLPDYKKSPISIRESKTGRVIAKIDIQDAQLGPIAWSPDERVLVVWIQGLTRPLTKFANTSYNQFEAINLVSGAVTDLSLPVEQHYNKYFAALFKILRSPEPGYAAYTQSYFWGFRPHGVMMEAGALGFNCFYVVNPENASIVDKDILPPTAKSSKLSSGDLEVVHHGDLVGEGDLQEWHEIYDDASGRRKRIDLYYLMKFGQSAKLTRRVVMEDDAVRIVEVN